MDEQECLRQIHEEGFDAEDLLRNAPGNLCAEFHKVDRALVRYLEKVREHFPDACYYTAGGGFTLMLGRDHAENRWQTPQQELVALIGRAQIGDGDF